jgi:tyrosyl-tRNA synthetase
MDKIKEAAEHFKHAFIACGVPKDKVKFIKPDEEYNLGYWEKVLAVSRELTIARTLRTVEIMGRKEAEALHVSDLIYTPMQVADIYQFNVNVCQLGMDQRKANMVAREVGEKIGFWKPICIHNILLQGLATPPIWPLPSDPTEQKQALASIKMSKSKPDTCIFIYDSPEDIKRKMNNAFCPAKEIKFNPILEVVKYIVFREKKMFEIKRPAKFGGDLQFESYAALEQSFVEGKLHPMDLKIATADVLADILAPVRSYFEKNADAKKTLEMINQFTVTR